MDELSGTQILRQLYRLENRSVKLGTEDEYIEKHSRVIRSKNKGYWVDRDADDYIKRLKASI